ncbi:MAG: transporter [Deltaproteobacteria bacterium]|nr:transporter [Deltaproteobacteria bacterium]
MSTVAGSPLTRLGDRVLRGGDGLGEFGLLAWGTVSSLRARGLPLRETLFQFEAIAVRSTPIVAVTALFTGMVLALQTAFALSRFGAKPYVGSIVGLAIVRELGPVLAALMVGGRVGAGITSELGSMQVTEQVDAIRAMGADPVQKLVIPRVVATTLGLPLLTLFAIALGVFGGLVVADLQYGITPSFYLQTITTTVTVGDFFAGVMKTFVFGWTIAMVGCFTGLRAEGGTAGVGEATTRSVVTASIAVLVSDFFLTKLLMLVPGEQILAWLARGLA